MSVDDQQQKSYYERDGKQYPRVTHILKIMDKSGLARWRGRLGNTDADAVAREGSRIGTEFHSIAGEIARGEHMKRGWQAPGEYRFMAGAYIDWLHRYVAKIVQIETTYFSDQEIGDDGEPLYAGTLDLLAHFRGDERPSIIDLKTSNSVSEDWPLQLSAYRRMVRRSGIEVARRVIVRIPKTGKVEAEMYDYSQVSSTADQDDERAWLDAVDLWRWQQGGKARAKGALVVAGLARVA